MNVGECREGLLPLTFSLMNKGFQIASAEPAGPEDWGREGGREERSSGLWIWAMSREQSSEPTNVLP